MMPSMVRSLVLLLLGRSTQAWNGLAVTPPMVRMRYDTLVLHRHCIHWPAAWSVRTPALQGWRSWNCFKLEVSQKIIEGQVTAVATPMGTEPSLLTLG
eukprot:SAG31_NODE_4362_length_3311_cov_2.094645_1_plen_98_part_00